MNSKKVFLTPSFQKQFYYIHFSCGAKKLPKNTSFPKWFVFQHMCIFGFPTGFVKKADRFSSELQVPMRKSAAEITFHHGSTFKRVVFQTYLLSNVISLISGVQKEINFLSKWFSTCKCSSAINFGRQQKHLNVISERPVPDAL